MSLNNIKKSEGFTIVELLIVIVVIGILAAITIVAYNGVQTRANNAAANSTGETIQKKAEAYNAVNSSYPTSTTDFNSLTESKLDGGIAIGSPSGSNGKTTVQYSTCVTPAGYKIATWDFSTGALEAVPTYGGAATSASTCTPKS